MKSNKKSPTRKIETHFTDNGSPFAYSTTSHSNIKVNAEIQPPLQLPGLVIFVHGVNSEGEWYDSSEEALCKGLNKRLGLDREFELISNKYYENHFESCGTNEFEISGCYDNNDRVKKSGLFLLEK